MYISDLEIKGFKSFVEPTRLKFSEGLTCIVGPNGCGKTNVVDAIRWVLGEQKSSVLRSQTMHDVIFSGTSKRKAVNFADVSLTIHNDKGVLPVEYTDVVVGRRVFRDGTSEYSINKTPCRLKDITDLFVDTGMGADAYSVIELKMVESILSESKDERRRLIEEAAEINKYKQQRRLSMRRLDATEMDLSRVGDIILEVEKNVGSLKRQLAKYRRFDRVRGQLKTDEMTLAAIQINGLNTQLTPLEKRITELNQDYGLSGEQVGLEEKRVEEAKTELTRLETERNEQFELVNARKGEQVAIEQTLLLADEKIANATASLDRIKVETRTLEERRTGASALDADLKNEIEHLYPRLETARMAYETKRSDFESAVQKYREAKTLHDERSQAHLDALNERGDLEHQRSRLEATLQQYRNQIGTLQDKRSRLGKAGEGFQLDLNLISDDFSNAENQYQGLEQEVGKLEQKFQELQESLGETREKLASKRGERVSVENQLNFYEELLESGEGYSSGVRRVLEAGTDIGGVLGILADLIKVDERYEQAIQAALGPLAQAVVTRDRASAIKAIEYLKDKSSGRAAFLPLKEINPTRGSGTAASDAKGVIGTAIEFITAEKGIEKALHSLLGDVLIVEENFTPDWQDLDRRYVTPLGTLYDPLGLIQGGEGGESRDTLVGRKDRLERLRKSFASLSEEIEDLTSGLEEMHDQIGRTEKEIRSTRTAREDQRQILLEFERKSSRAQYGISSTHSDLETLENELSNTQGAIVTAEQQLSDLEKPISEALARKETIETELASIEADLQSLLNERDKVSDTAQNAKLDVVNLENEERNLKTRLESIAETLRDIEARIEGLADEKSQYEASLEKNRSLREEEKVKLSTVKTDVGRESEILTELDGRNQVKRQALNELELRLRDHHHQRESAAEELRELSVQVANLKSSRSHILERIQEKYNEDPPGELPDEEIDLEALEKRIKRSERFIENLGPINMAVQDEFEAEQSRLNFLREQQADLVDAKTSLLETVSKLDRIARRQFRETFLKIQEHFKITFQMLFDGGDADLSLDNPDDVLESDIAIKATPKGKKTQNLKMLSAGEKALTAIALLFAIYQVKPSPYCVLDEVDAPLDDRNIRKYTKMLEHFTTHTQFIVITHNKLTMEAARYLYGVTMEEEGVSKLVSVQLT